MTLPRSTCKNLHPCSMRFARLHAFCHHMQIWVIAPYSQLLQARTSSLQKPHSQSQHPSQRNQDPPHAHMTHGEHHCMATLFTELDPLTERRCPHAGKLFRNPSVTHAHVQLPMSMPQCGLSPTSPLHFETQVMLHAEGRRRLTLQNKLSGMMNHSSRFHRGLHFVVGAVHFRPRCTCMHAYLHKYIHTYIHTYMPTCTKAQMHTCVLM